MGSSKEPVPFASPLGPERSKNTFFKSPFGKTTHTGTPVAATPNKKSTNAGNLVNKELFFSSPGGPTGNPVESPKKGGSRKQKKHRFTLRRFTLRRSSKKTRHSSKKSRRSKVSRR